jgi:pteridine reductase
MEGKWVLITGGAKRLGECTARTLHAAGANIAVHYRRSAAPAEALVASLNAARRDSALAVRADLLSSAQLVAAVDAVIARAGRLDALINNASSFYPTPLGEVTEEQWVDLIGTNLKAPLFLSQAVLPHLRKNRGSIVNLIDVHAIRPLRNHPVYGAAKAGLAMLTKSLARDLAPDVRVNGVAPGAILWPDGGVGSKTEDSVLRQIPMGRTGTPEDVAACVLFLLRDAPYITGQIIAVDGGRSIGWQ